MIHLVALVSFLGNPMLLADAGGAPTTCELSTVDGVRVLTVRGSFHARGLAQGWCLAEDVLAVVDDYALAGIPPVLFKVLKAGLRRRLEAPSGLREEARGLVEGATARLGEGFRSRRLGRVLDLDDVLVINAYVDFMASGCSSLSAWGGATAGGPLRGAPALARNLDWSTDPVLLARQLVVVHHPVEPDREPFLSVTFPGLLGCLSCVDASGTAAFLNLGYGPHRGSLFTASRVQPVTMSLREAVERRDPDGDGETGTREVAGALEDLPTVGSYGIHVLVPSAPGGEPPARVVELNARGLAERTESRSDAFGEDTLGLTNHLQVLDWPVPCRRYQRLAEVSARRDLDGPALWGAMASVILEGATLQTMLYLPGERRLRLWLRPAGHQGPGAWEDAAELDLVTLLGGSP